MLDLKMVSIGVNFLNEDFVAWLNDELERKGWNYSELARRGEITHASISQIVSGRKPGEKVCRAIAHAFQIPPDEVMRRAGILPKQADNRKQFEEFVDWLTPEEREEFWDYIEVYRASVTAKRAAKATRAPISTGAGSTSKQKRPPRPRESTNT